MSDVIAELRRLYEAAIQHAGDLDETASVLALSIAVVHHLPALLDAIDALRWYADEDNYYDPTDVPDHLYRDSGDVLLIRGGGGQRARAALAALERSDEG